MLVGEKKVEPRGKEGLELLYDLTLVVEELQAGDDDGRLGRAPDEGWCARYEKRYAELLGDTSHWRSPDGAVETLHTLERRGVLRHLLLGRRALRERGH